MSTEVKVLLAKGYKSNRPHLTLEKHLSDTEEAVMALFGPGRRWGRSMVRFFKIEVLYEAFILNLRLAALFHDLGKANADFLFAMKSDSFQPQLIRHEHISALILHLPGIRNWLSKAANVDVEAITGAVLSHHLKAGPGSQGHEDYEWGGPRADRSQVGLYLDHPEVKNILRRVADLIEDTQIPELPTQPMTFEGKKLVSPWREALRDGRDTANKYRRKLNKSPDRHQLLLALKAGLIASDSVASAMFREQESIDKWVAEAMNNALTDKDVENSLIRPRLDAIARSVGGPVTLKDFQTEVAKQGDRTLLLAACGSGKTLAAWEWAKEQLKHHELGRVIFLYPTRGTATEGFKDYVGWTPDEEGSLLHGSAAYELEQMIANPPESVRDKNLVDESAKRLFALGYWPRRYFSATADQFFSFLENQYGGLCMVPLMADAVLVVDEVHSYDDLMFRSLLSYLKYFSGPVLCMTATLPTTRQKELEECGLKIFPSEIQANHLQELQVAEEKPRYKIRQEESLERAESTAIQAYNDGLRVLYVVNTVKRCQEAARRLAERLKTEVLIYHSRFRLKDRQKAHQKTVASFQQDERPVIAVTTQVCEMSLDIDADFLLTENAPVTSLVQRFGRANRKGRREYAQILAIPTPGDLPYERHELKQAGAFLSELTKMPDRVSQRQLAEKLKKYAGDNDRLEEYASFISSGYYALPGSFRDIDERLSCTSVLDSDLKEVLRLLDDKRPIDAYLLPVPRSGENLLPPTPGLPKYLYVAPASQYSTISGFSAQGEKSE